MINKNLVEKEPPALLPCQVNGQHDVENIRLLNLKDEGNVYLWNHEGYRYRARCVHCGESIIAKDKSEYDQFK